MERLKNFFKNNQQTLALVVGYIIVAGLAFGVGRFAVPKIPAWQPEVQSAATVPDNYTPNVSGAQTTKDAVPPLGAVNCEGKIKGSSSMIYHLPGGAFYAKTTNPIRCFNTEAEAQAAGFRKSSR